MSQQQRLLQLPLVGTILLCLLVCVYLVAKKRSAKSASSIPISKHSVENSSEEALNYWTADRMRTAKPAPMPNVKALKREKKHPRRPPSDPQGS